MKKLKTKIANILVLFIGSLPLLWTAGVFLFAVRARLQLGYWPSPNQPDPQIFSFETHDLILFFTAYAVLGSLVAFPSIRILLSNNIHSAVWRHSKKAFLSGWGVIFVLIVMPKINFIAWYLD